MPSTDKVTARKLMHMDKVILSLMVLTVALDSFFKYGSFEMSSLSHVFQYCADGHDKRNFACRKQIANSDCRKHGNTDQKSGRNLADAGIVKHSPYCQIKQRNTADDDSHPCGVKWQESKVYRLPSKFLHQMGNQIQQQECTRYNRHGKSGQKIIYFFNINCTSIFLDTAAKYLYTLFVIKHFVRYILYELSRGKTMIRSGTM